MGPSASLPDHPHAPAPQRTRACAVPPLTFLKGPAKTGDGVQGMFQLRRWRQDPLGTADEHGAQGEAVTSKPAFLDKNVTQGQVCAGIWWLYLNAARLPIQPLLEGTALVGAAADWALGAAALTLCHPRLLSDH